MTELRRGGRVFEGMSDEKHLDMWPGRDKLLIVTLVARYFFGDGP